MTALASRLDGSRVAALYLAGRARAWRGLLAWRQPLADVVFGFAPYDPVKDIALGRAYHDRSTQPPVRTVMVYVTGYMAEDLETVIHEIAHHAVGCAAGHSAPWYERLAAAVTEVTRIPAPAWEDCAAMPRDEDREPGVHTYDGRLVAHLVAWMEMTGTARWLRDMGVLLWKADDPPESVDVAQAAAG